MDVARRAVVRCDVIGSAVLVVCCAVPCRVPLTWLKAEHPCLETVQRRFDVLWALRRGMAAGSEAEEGRDRETETTEPVSVDGQPPDKARESGPVLKSMLQASV
jgi:hypothetical protein